MSFVIYAIVDPRCRKVFYVGHTSRLDLRSGQHLEAGETICGLCIREILTAGQEPQFFILQDCESERAALMAEVFWIDLLSGRGVALTNNQAFDGYSARAEEKRRLREELGAGTRMEQLAAIANGRPVREGRRWSRKEDQMMRRLKREGKSELEIADELSRSVGAIEARLAQKAV
ncbi:MAG: GIY-YIG nuclease family protein [Rhizobiales bacterium]|nr:GIY-YIG nuclease family protein [Hyphomicrobiales bacterium]